MDVLEPRMHEEHVFLGRVCSIPQDSRFLKFKKLRYSGDWSECLGSGSSLGRARHKFGSFWNRQGWKETHWQRVMSIARFAQTEVLVCGTLVPKCCNCAVGPVRLFEETKPWHQWRLLGPVQMVGVLHHSFALSGSSRSRGGTGGFGHRIDAQSVKWHGVTYPRSCETLGKHGGCFKWCVQSALYVSERFATFGALSGWYLAEHGRWSYR